MKKYFDFKINFIVVSLLILIQFPEFECRRSRVQCPNTIPTECTCKSDPFVFKCSKNNEEISYVDTTPPGNDDFRNQFSMELNCSKVNDGKIFESMQFTEKSSPYKNRVKLTINSCPMEVLSAIEKSNIIAADSTYLDIVVNDLASLPENYFLNQNDLFSLKLNGNQLKHLPESVFDNLATLRILYLNGNKMTSLPKNIFKKLTDLSSLEVTDNQLTVLSENMFEGLSELGIIEFSRNQLTELPNNIFKGLENLLFLYVGENQLTTLSENIFENSLSLKHLGLNDNQLTELPENIFKDRIYLGYVYLHNNNLTELAENIFKDQRNLKWLYLSGNQLKTLPRNIFNSQIGGEGKQFVLKGNPWVCDEDFVEIAREHKDKIDYKEIVCADGVPLEDKMNAF